ncbi:hypothetical protein B484DRAFT_279301, partial [Ochromonadaceae sp. CCMP2298]
NVSVRAVAKSFNCNYSTLNRRICNHTYTPPTPEDVATAGVIVVDGGGAGQLQLGVEFGDRVEGDCQESEIVGAGADFFVVCGSPGSEHPMHSTDHSDVADLSMQLASTSLGSPDSRILPTDHLKSLASHSSGPASPPLKRRKKAVTTLADVSLRRAMREMRALSSLETLVKQMLKADGRSAGPEDVAVTLRYVAAQASNQAGKFRGAVRDMKPVGTKSALNAGTSEKLKILAASEMAQQLGRSLLAATKKTVDRARILSSLVTDFNLQQLNDLVLGLSTDSPERIKRHEYSVALEHNRIYGAGNVGPCQGPRVRRRLRVDDADEGAQDARGLSFCVELVKGYLTPLAFGTKTVKLSMGVELEIPRIELKCAKAVVIEAYKFAVKEQHKEHAQYRRLREADPAQEPFNERLEQPLVLLCHAHVDLVVDTLTGSKENANLAALDSVYVKCCLENGERTQFLIDVITENRSDLRLQLLAQQEVAQVFLHKLYPNHLFDDSRCAGHSKKYAFGDMDEAEEKRLLECEQFCRDCASVAIFQANMRLAIAGATLKPEEDSREQLLRYFDGTLCAETERYKAHVVRKTHETAL